MRTALAIATRLSLAAIGGALGVVAAAAGCILVDRQAAARRKGRALHPGAFEASPYNRRHP